MNNKTIIYYTSNREDPVFEKKIQDNIMANKGDIPIISVSQKPIDFGENICVGDVGAAYHNEWRQIYIGAKQATTKYIIFAEADFLYHSDYFNFNPTDENKCYRYDNVWIVYKNPRFGSYLKKKYSEGAQICGRELLIKMYEKYFEGVPEWCDEKTPIRKKDPFYKYKYELFGGGPCVSFKTGKGVRYMTNTMRDIPHEKVLLPWGNVKDLRTKFL